MKKVYKRKICPAYETGQSGSQRFYIDIEFTTDGRLSLCGNWHGFGQNYNDLFDDSLKPMPDFTQKDIIKIYSIWKRWHLNDMRAGTPRQERIIRRWEKMHKYDYTEACKVLENHGLLYDDGYKYGSAWLFEEVPEMIIKWLFCLPKCGDFQSFDWDDVKVLFAKFTENELEKIWDIGA